MASDAFSFQGTDLLALATSGTEVTSIGEVKGLNGPNGQAQINDVTHSKSVAIEKLMGLPDNGRITVNANLLHADAGHQLLHANREAQTRNKYRIDFADAASTKWEFDAFVMSYNPSGSANTPWDVNIDFEVTGGITRSAG